MTGIITTADILSFMIVTVILIGALMSSKKSRRTSTKMFIGLMITDLLAIIVDIISYTSEDFIVNDTLLRLINLLAYCFIVLILVMFSLYMISVIREKTKISYRMLIPVLIMSGINIILLVIGTLNRKLFTIIEHKYVAREWHLIPYVMALLHLLYLCFIMIKYCRGIEKRFILGLSSYLFFPFLLSVGVLFFNFPDFTYAAASLTFLVIYVAIQSQTITEVLLREKILNEVSYIDSLTGLKNRRAYDEYLQNVENESGKGVAFFDLNSLKYTNDTYGHASGDRLIKSFADMLRKAFPDGHCFRISGDEFVVLLRSNSKKEIEKRMDSFYEAVYKKDRMAAMGFVYNDDRDMLSMVREAEKKMYSDKALYYKETGKDRRI